MDKFIPDGFLTSRQAVAKLVLAKFGGLPDRAVVHALKEEGIDVADGAAADDAFAEIWAALDDGKLQLFVMSSKDHLRQHELTPKMASQIPGLRSPRGRDLTFLRNRHPLMPQFVKWFGKDFKSRDLTVLFREDQVVKLARVQLRRRREATGNKRGRPSNRCEVKKFIREVIDSRKWSSIQPLKLLTAQVNRRSKTLNFSEDTVARALNELHGESHDQRFARLRRRSQGDSQKNGVLRQLD